jgi:hypothetical protein
VIILRDYRDHRLAPLTLDSLDFEGSVWDLFCVLTSSFRMLGEEESIAAQIDAVKMIAAYLRDEFTKGRLIDPKTGEWGIIRHDAEKIGRGRPGEPDSAERVAAHLGRRNWTQTKVQRLLHLATKLDPGADLTTCFTMWYGALHESPSEKVDGHTDRSISARQASEDRRETRSHDKLFNPPRCKRVHRKTWRQ